MSDFLFADAIGLLDAKLIEDHMAEKIKRKKAWLLRKKLKTATVAAAFVIMISSTFALHSVFQAQMGEVDMQATVGYGVLAVFLGIIISAVTGLVIWKTASHHIKKRLCSFDDVK